MTAKHWILGGACLAVIAALGAWIYIYLDNKDMTERAALWESSRKDNTIAAYKHFLEIYPKGYYSEEAKKAYYSLEEGEWAKIKSSSDQSSFMAFIKIFPEGKHIDEAKSSIQNIQRQVEEEKQHEWNKRLTEELTRLEREKIAERKRNPLDGDVTNEGYTVIRPFLVKAKLVNNTKNIYGGKSFVDSSIHYTAKARYYVVEAEIINHSKLPQSLPNIFLKDQSGKIYSRSHIYPQRYPFDSSNDLNPDVPTKVFPIFDVPEDNRYNLAIVVKEDSSTFRNAIIPLSSEPER